MLAIAALAITCAVFYFFVDVRDHQNVYVGWRVGHFLFIGAAAVFALLFVEVAALPSARGRLAVMAIAAVLLLALPTTAIDLFNTQDIENRAEAPVGRFTLILSPEDLQLFEWLKRNTRPDAIVQVDPLAKDSTTWAYLPAFAERRMAVGLPISMVPLAKYEAGSRRMSEMYDADARAAYDIALQNHINYVIIGPPERQAHPGAEKRLDSIPALMPLVLRNANISVYAVLPEI